MSSITNVLLLILPIFSFATNYDAEIGAFPASEDISHAFVQTDSELHYFRDISTNDIKHLVKPPDIKPEEKAEVFILQPESLNFGNGPIGVPRRANVVIMNPNSIDVVFLAIGAYSQNFYFTFPNEKIVKAYGNTTITVTFLPKNEGVVSAVLNLHTSHFVAKLKVSGEATGNPYRIKNVVNAKLPVKESLEIPIQLHNPHPHKLLLNYIVASDQDIVINDNFLEKPSALIPFETAKIAVATIIGTYERNTTVFILINGDVSPYRKGAVQPVNLVIALNIEVTKKKGIFATTDVLDFGLLKYGERSERLVFEVISNVDNGIDIDAITYTFKNNVAAYGVHLQYASKAPISVSSSKTDFKGASKPVPVAYVHVDSNYFPLNISQTIHVVEGTIVAESRGGNYNVSVDFKATIFVGDISQNIKDAAFYLSLNPAVTRVLSLSHNYPFGLGIWNVTLPKADRSYFDVELIRPVVEISPFETKPSLVVTYKKKVPGVYNVSCIVSSNVTDFKVVLLVFKGNVEITLNSINPTHKEIDLGDISIGERRSFYFSIKNNNPVPLLLKKMDDPIPNKVIVNPIGMVLNNRSSTLSLSKTEMFWQADDEFMFPSHSSTMFNLTVAPSSILGDEVHTIMEIETEFESFTFPIKYKIVNDSLRFVDTVLHLGQAFPGKTSRKEIKMYGHVEKPVRILRISSLTDDGRFNFNINSRKDILVTNNSLVSLGELTFSPSMSCSSDCYCGFNTGIPDGQWFTHGMKLPPNLPEIDSYLYQRLRMRWHALTEKKVKTKVLVDTDRFKSLEIEAETELSWPKLFSHPVVHFPLTAVGNFTILNLTLSNPSTEPVIVQLLPLVIYPDAEALMEFFRGEFPEPPLDSVEMNETLMFSLRDTELFTLKPGSPVPQLREEVERVVNRQIPRFTLSMILKPAMKTRIRIGFLPTDFNLKSSLLLIRNNLTAVEPVVLYGKGARAGLEIDGKEAFEAKLLFDILMSHLSDCYNPKRLTHKLGTNLTVKRSFIIRNSGEVELWITSISISGTQCADRGFRVLNCKPFIIAPNQTYELDIAYTPDFLMSVNEASLLLYTHMNGTPWSLDLIATVAPEMLEVCHAALPRPPFEWLMYYACLFALVFCMICIVACAYLEGDRCLTEMIHQQVEDIADNEEQYFIIHVREDNGEDLHQNRSLLWRIFHSKGDPNFKPLVSWNYSSDSILAYVGVVVNYIAFLYSNMWWIIRGDIIAKIHEKRKNKKGKNNNDDNKKTENEIKLLEERTRQIESVIQQDLANQASQRSNKLRKRRAGKKTQEQSRPILPSGDYNDFSKEYPPAESQFADSMKSTQSTEDSSIFSLSANKEPEVFNEEKEDDLIQNELEDNLNRESDSPPPEWADVTISPDDDETGFDILANQSSALFDDLDNHSPTTSTSSTSPTKPDEPNILNSSWLTPREIDRLVEEYRQRLIEASKIELTNGHILPKLPSYPMESLMPEIPEFSAYIQPPPDTVYFPESQGQENFYDQLLRYQQEQQLAHDLQTQQLWQNMAGAYNNSTPADYPWVFNTPESFKFPPTSSAPETEPSEERPDVNNSFNFPFEDPIWSSGEAEGQFNWPDFNNDK